jgi:hypothetical protein
MLDKNYFIHLGGVVRFLEVWKNPEATPRDRLLAKRTLMHRPIILYSEFLNQQNQTINMDSNICNSIDLIISEINILRTMDNVNLEQIESLVGRLRNLFYA